MRSRAPHGRRVPGPCRKRPGYGATTDQNTCTSKAPDGIAVAAEAGDGDAAVELCAELQPDLVIMDLQLPGLHGIDATRKIVARRPGTAVLVLTMFERAQAIIAARDAGLGRQAGRQGDGTAGR